MQSVKCPYCNSTKTRPTTKEISTGWQVGLSNILVAKYQREQKATFTEMDCLDCGKSFPQEIEQRSTTPEFHWVGKKVSVQTRLGVRVEAEIRSENVIVRVRTEGDDIIAKEQLMIEMRQAIINFDSPMLVTESGMLIGVMWGSSVSSHGFSSGIVQPISTLRMNEP